MELIEYSIQVANTKINFEILSHKPDFRKFGYILFRCDKFQYPKPIRLNQESNAKMKIDFLKSKIYNYKCTQASCNVRLNKKKTQVC